MKRPFAVMGICYISALAVALCSGEDSIFPLCVIFTLISILCICIKKIRHFCVISITSLVAVLMLWGYTYAFLTPYISLKGQTMEITGTLCELPYKSYDRYYYQIRTNEYAVLVSSRYKIKIEPFDILKATVKFYSETEPSQELYDFSHKITIRASIDSMKPKTVTKTDSKPLYYYALMTRQYMTDKINSLLSEREAGFVNAIMTGDKYQLPESDKNILRAAGISHIIVISGFHVAVITHLMLAFFLFVTRKRKRLSCALCIIFVFFYMAVTGFRSPVVRADIMQIFILVGNIVARKSDSFNILGLSALVICFINPYAVADVSFIMSFSATFGILLISPNIYIWTMERISAKKLYFLIKALVNIFAVSLAAYIFIVPITIIYFKQAAVYSVITNLLVSFAVTALIYTAVFMIITSLVPLAWIAAFLADYILNVAQAVAGLPFPIIETSQEFVPFWLITAIMAGFIIIIFKFSKRAIKYYAFITVMSFILLSVGDTFLKNGSTKISVLDVGDGISCVVNYDNRTYLLSSGGSYYKSHTLDVYLTESCVSDIAYMLMLDDKNACTAYSKRILEHYDIDTLQILNESKYTENVKLLVSDITHKTDSKNVYIGDTEIHAENSKHCTAVRAVFGQLHILLAYGKTDCRNIPESWLDTDIFIMNGDIKNAEMINSLITILSDEEHEGTIAMRAYPDKKIDIRRENGWLN